MEKFISMSNGPVNFLVNITDTVTIQEKMDDGFYAEVDDDGEVKIIESSELTYSTDAKVNQVLDMIKSKQKSTKKTNKLSKK